MGKRTNASTQRQRVFGNNYRSLVEGTREYLRLGREEFDRRELDRYRKSTTGGSGMRVK